MNTSENENALEVQVKIYKIFEEFEVKAEIVNLHKLGSYAKLKAHPDKPRLTFVKFKNSWDARIFLARAEGKQAVLEKDGIYIRRALTRDEILKEKACLKKNPENY